MAYSYEELARGFVHTPVDLFGVYRTQLEANQVYSGHVDKPTSKCAIICALSGAAEFIFDGEERYRLEPGKILIGGAGRRLEIIVGDSGFQYNIVHYMPNTAEAVPGSLERNHDITLLEVTVDPELLRLQEQLLQAASVPDNMGMLAKKSLFYQYVAKLLQSERNRQNKDSYSVIDDALGHIHDRFMDSLTLAGLAERYQLKPKYFSYLFHKYTGTGPIDYLIHYRMNKAHEWLLTEQVSVSAVAKSVGYADSYYFSRLFKKYKGIAPSRVGHLHQKK
ncbi:helix-turn-helix transcriptional regulator [Paenibacillus sp. CF384]|uniref:helix-turn-helix transcriptional regulator n=1 Tax=Paenibacillus sp. CF384 TaxID=1884382 RepID=UPI00089AC724|nr:AraC family transcriptional regulator [Paenibacillus sp. CF384]SDX57299.1 AraC-like ligand binding domain-containing protein [Paenibacillus sp. CF384]